MPKFNPNPSPLEIARRAAGLSRRQLGEKSGVNFRIIEHYEQGRRDINNAAVHQVLALAQALDVPIEDILNPPK